MAWKVSAGSGIVYSHTIVHRPQTADFVVPYAVAIVSVDEGFHMLTNIVGCAPEDVAIGMAVEVVFDRSPVRAALPYFRPARGPG
ncbi:Zn-ribbon domain-containing OB-fold protein [Tomitella fengzijianii]|uniref:Zn-ribbon domain-containing OB-fold protein n=1 Tax=Tomitella fengzijianii TaxID=2597660 RepID=UPI001E59F9E0|nr:OB-fold domain-containing protein [Tomitella fengzijianii]